MRLRGDQWNPKWALAPGAARLGARPRHRPSRLGTQARLPYLLLCGPWKGHWATGQSHTAP